MQSPEETSGYKQNFYSLCHGIYSYPDCPMIIVRSPAITAKKIALDAEQLIQCYSGARRSNFSFCEAVKHEQHIPNES